MKSSYEMFPCVTLARHPDGTAKWKARTGCRWGGCWHHCGGGDGYGGLPWCITNTYKIRYLKCKTDEDCVEILTDLSENGKKPENFKCQQACGVRPGQVMKR